VAAVGLWNYYTFGFLLSAHTQSAPSSALSAAFTRAAAAHSLCTCVSRGRRRRLRAHWSAQRIHVSRMVCEQSSHTHNHPGPAYCVHNRVHKKRAHIHAHTVLYCFFCECGWPRGGFACLVDNSFKLPFAADIANSGRNYTLQ
jgi:hypothetical protein